MEQGNNGTKLRFSRLYSAKGKRIQSKGYSIPYLLILLYIAALVTAKVRR
jgi:hypothetical protein